jgi:hypothetical protein
MSALPVAIRDASDHFFSIIDLLVVAHPCAGQDIESTPDADIERDCIRSGNLFGATDTFVIEARSRLESRGGRLCFLLERLQDSTYTTALLAGRPPLWAVVLAASQRWLKVFYTVLRAQWLHDLHQFQLSMSMWKTVPNSLHNVLMHAYELEPSDSFAHCPAFSIHDQYWLWNLRSIENVAIGNFIGPRSAATSSPELAAETGVYALEVEIAFADAARNTTLIAAALQQPDWEAYFRDLPAHVKAHFGKMFAKFGSRRAFLMHLLYIGESTHLWRRFCNHTGRKPHSSVAGLRLFLKIVQRLLDDAGLALPRLTLTLRQIASHELVSTLVAAGPRFYAHRSDAVLRTIGFGSGRLSAARLVLLELEGLDIDCLRRGLKPLPRGHMPLGAPEYFCFNHLATIDYLLTSYDPDWLIVSREKLAGVLAAEQARSDAVGGIAGLVIVPTLRHLAQFAAANLSEFPECRPFLLLLARLPDTDFFSYDLAERVVRVLRANSAKHKQSQIIDLYVTDCPTCGDSIGKLSFGDLASERARPAVELHCLQCTSVITVSHPSPARTALLAAPCHQVLCVREMVMDDHPVLVRGIVQEFLERAVGDHRHGVYHMLQRSLFDPATDMIVIWYRCEACKTRTPHALTRRPRSAAAGAPSTARAQAIAINYCRCKNSVERTNGVPVPLLAKIMIRCLAHVSLHERRSPRAVDDKEVDSMPFDMTIGLRADLAAEIDAIAKHRRVQTDGDIDEMWSELVDRCRDHAAFRVERSQRRLSIPGFASAPQFYAPRERRVAEAASAAADL